jgi:hypothetical protein
MKCLQNIVISSDGSIFFVEKPFKNSNFVTFHVKDDKNFNYYHKTKIFNNDSKHLQTYKKKYLK